jgi:hypothetical protein
MKKKTIKKKVKEIVTGKKAPKKKKVDPSNFMAGYFGAKAAGASDDEALMFGIIMDDED